MPGVPGARFWLDLLSSGVALLLFLFVYQSRTRSLLSGTLIALTAAAGHFVHVYVDRETRRPVPVPAPLRAVLEKLVPHRD